MNYNIPKTALIIHNVLNKSILALVTLMIFTSINSNSFGQDDDKKMRIGLGTGIGFSWFKPDNAVKKDNKMTKNGVRFVYNLGVILEYKFGANYAFSTGINISKTGGGLTYLVDTILSKKSDGPGDQVEYIKANSNYSYKISNIEIPLLLKLNTNEIGYLTYFGQVGFGLNMRTSTGGSISYENPTPTGATFANKKLEDQDLSSHISFFRAALIFGGGVEYNLSGNTSIVLGFLFKSGLNNAMSSKLDKSTTNKLMGANDLIQESSGNDTHFKFANESDKNYRGLSKKATGNQFLLTVGIFF